MSVVLDAINTLWNQILYALSHIRIADILDILIVAFVIYKAIELFRDTRAGQLFKGIAILVVIFFLAQWFNMISLKWLLLKVIDSAIIAIAIVFQPELRRALERVGRSKLGGIGKNASLEDERDVMMRCIDAVCKAAGSMQEQRIGALIVFERSTLLGEIINTGTIVNADTSTQLIGNIFYPKSPLHDGAMVIREGRVYAAGCILPLTSNNNINSQLGTRHRAAIGMSENSDALVVVVSEETGNISVAINGKMTRDFNAITLRDELNKHLMSEYGQDGNKKGIFSRLKWKKNKTNPDA